MRRAPRLQTALRQQQGLYPRESRATGGTRASARMLPGGPPRCEAPADSLLTPLMGPKVSLK